MWKIDLLWFCVYKGWLMPAHARLYNLSLHYPYCLLCFPSPPQKDIKFLLSYFRSDEQLFEVLLILQNYKFWCRWQVLQIFWILKKTLPMIFSIKSQWTFSLSAYTLGGPNKLFALSSSGNLKREINPYCKKYLASCYIFLYMKQLDSLTKSIRTFSWSGP